MIVGQDDVEGGVELGEEVSLGLHPFPDRLEAGAAELVEDQSGVILAIFEQQDAERSGHRQRSLFDEAAESEVALHGGKWPTSNRSGASTASIGYVEPAWPPEGQDLNQDTSSRMRASRPGLAGGAVGGCHTLPLAGQIRRTMRMNARPPWMQMSMSESASPVRWAST